jgi:hypothetical protein
MLFTQTPPALGNQYDDDSALRAYLTRVLPAEVLAEGETLHLVTNENKKVRTLPQIYKEKLLTEITDENAFPENEALHLDFGF